MNIMIYHPAMPAGIWLNGLRRRLPEANVRVWRPGDDAPADYALVWHPPLDMLAGRAGLKGVFALGAGVDAIMDMLRAHPDALAPDVPLLRLEDAGMATQMAEYVCAAVLRYYRRFDDYQAGQSQGFWRELALPDKRNFVVGIAGAGVLGARAAQVLAALGFSVRLWSRRPKSLPGIAGYGEQQRDAFLAGLRVLVNLLPDTPLTRDILNSALFAKLGRGAYLINAARGKHLVEADLLAALASGQIAAATLDVCRDEPPAADHPFWSAPRVTLTPHIAAATLPEPALDNIVDNIHRIEAGLSPSGYVDRANGY
ncbi:2-hydroxyacid dehydrogenase [Martelella alba]|uniref:Glyoxylate/hydroxypyruvate reductase A n=1 Tax=Martelella alba TaxID=2590451 RepID=A0ABY2SRZ6_9HYPH|nr:glyoxylate/hydroxypyruvate reductase A [Martelella alba]TKI08260.1 glyoxylate/hydroxypyruvate reductase A [Martelella alba]